VAWRVPRIYATNVNKYHIATLLARRSIDTSIKKIVKYQYVPIVERRVIVII